MRVENWLPLLIVVFLMGAYLNLPWMVFFSTAISSVIGIAQLWKERSTKDVIYTRRFHYIRGFPGEQTTVQLEVQNNKWLPLSWLRVVDMWPMDTPTADPELLRPTNIQGKGELTNAYSLKWHDKIQRKFNVVFKTRGIYPIGPAKITTGDFFGLYDKTIETRQEQYLTVFPEILPMEKLKLNTNDPFGDRAAQRRLFEDPNRPVGIREYHPEDGMKRIHWTATARTGSLQVKVYQPVTARVMMVCLNVATSIQPWLGINSEMLEQLVKIAASVAYNSVEEGYSVGLIANGCLAHSDQPFNIAPGRTPQQLASLLQALAGVTSYVTAPFEVFLNKAMSKTPYGATIVIITSVISDNLVETLIRLKRYRPSITLFSLAETAPSAIPGIQTIHLPYTGEVVSHA